MKRHGCNQVNTRLLFKGATRENVKAFLAAKQVLCTRAPLSARAPDNPHEKERAVQSARGSRPDVFALPD
jgi:hypothetical protein